HRNDDDLPRVRAVGLRADADGYLLAGRVLEARIDIVAGPEIAARDRDEVLAGLHIHTRLRERRLQLRIPVLSAVDAGEAVTPVVDGVVAAEEAARNGFGFEHVA